MPWWVLETAPAINAASVVLVFALAPLSWLRTSANMRGLYLFVAEAAACAKSYVKIMLLSQKCS